MLIQTNNPFHSVNNIPIRKDAFKKIIALSFLIVSCVVVTDVVINRGRFSKSISGPLLAVVVGGLIMGLFFKKPPKPRQIGLLNLPPDLLRSMLSPPKGSPPSELEKDYTSHTTSRLVCRYLRDTLFCEHSKTLAQSIMPKAALYGHLEVLKWARDQRSIRRLGHSLFLPFVGRMNKGLYGEFGITTQRGQFTQEERAQLALYDEQICVENAAKGGNLHVLKWLRFNTRGSWNGGVCASAARGGHLFVLQWLKTQGIPWHESTCESAAEGGHLQVLHWARQNGAPWDTGVCQKAAQKGHLEILRYAGDNGAPWSRHVTYFAAESGNLEILQLVRSYGAPWHVDATGMLARKGCLETLQWARADGAPWSRFTCLSAVEGGLEVLQWARANGASWGTETCAFAVTLGNLPVLQWARENGAPWLENICSYAAEHGHLEILQWLRTQGAPWNEDVRRIARQNGHHALLKWAEENGAP